LIGYPGLQGGGRKVKEKKGIMTVAGFTTCSLTPMVTKNGVVSSSHQRQLQGYLCRDYAKGTNGNNPGPYAGKQAHSE
jgi:hypothetical protein